MISLSPLVILFITFQSISPCYAMLEECNMIIHKDFENCRTEDNTQEKIRLHSCKNTSICDRKFNISYIKITPYYEMSYMVKEMVNFCCGRCSNIIIGNIFNDDSKLNMIALATSDFVYPFLAPTSANQLYGFHFIPMIDVPSVYYITAKKQSPRDTLFNLVKACAELWPLFLICLLLASISGFAVWIIETWKNADQFSRTFCVGMFDGFWWAFISMTTVGYGDKAPQSWPARVVAVLWILMGITMCAMFTASLTTAILSAITPKPPEMHGKTVGWLKHRLYEATVIAQHGGRLIAIEDDDYMSGIKKLFKFLSDGKTEGIVLDKYVFNLFKTRVSNRLGKLYDKQIAEQIVNKSILTEIFNKGDKLSFGLLVKSYQDNAYFRKYITDNMLQVKTCNTFRLNSDTVKETDEINLFSVQAGLFWPSFASSMGILAGICFFGLIFELFRKHFTCFRINKMFLRKKDRSLSRHTAYQQQWIDLFTEGDKVIGRTQESQIITKRDIRNELANQNVSVIYLDNCDVLIFKGEY